MNNSAPEFGAATRVFRLLMLAYPAAFRREYGSEMEIVFRDMARDAWRDRRRIGLAGVWCRVVFDVAQSGSVERLRAVRHYLASRRFFADPRYLLPALALSLAIAAAVTPADPLSMFLVGLPLYGVYLGVFSSAGLPRTARLLVISVAVLNLLGVAGWLVTVLNRAPADAAGAAPISWIAALVVPQLVWVVDVACAVGLGRRSREGRGQVSRKS